MRDIANDLIAYLDRRLATMARAPDSWGSPESMELQALLLLEIRTFVLRRETYDRNPFEVRNLHNAFVRDHFPGTPPSIMADIISPNTIEVELPRLVAEFISNAKTLLASEDLFAHHPVAIELEFISEPTIDRVCRYYSQFRKLGSGKRTRTQFAMPSIRILQKNGRGPCVQIPLHEAGSIQETFGDAFGHRNAFLGELNTLMDVATWVAAPDGTPQPEFANNQRRKKAVETALAVFPGDGVQTVTMGGTAIKRQVVMRAESAHRLVNLVAKSDVSRNFRETGKVMAIDYEQGHFRLHVKKNKYRCWTMLDRGILDKAKEVAPDGEIEVIGRLHAVSHVEVTGVSIVRVANRNGTANHAS